MFTVLAGFYAAYHLFTYNAIAYDVTETTIACQDWDGKFYATHQLKQAPEGAKENGNG